MSVDNKLGLDGGFSHPYIPSTPEERQEMLERIGVPDVEALFSDIPEECRIDGLDLPPGLPELGLRRELAMMAGRNTEVSETSDTPCFLGGGASRHYIPAAVAAITSRSEFATAYTPYQPEISQGTLQYTYEFQSMVCELTGMDVANTGMYDGSTALAEAVLMTSRLTGLSNIMALFGVNPAAMDVVRTYASGPGLTIDEMPDSEDVPEIKPGTAAVIVQYPDHCGRIRDLKPLADAAHKAGALLIVHSNDLIALGMLRSPGESGADIAVGEAGALGNPPSFGGPVLGIFAIDRTLLRQMPGRIVGRTTDHDERTGYVLTLQTREQHIRRERATSNICTSEALVALGAAVYLALMGSRGLRRVAELCYHKAHYAAGRIAAIPGFELPFAKIPFFNEFVVQTPEGITPREVNRYLLRRGIIGGIDVSDMVPRGLLLCVTELNTREEIDRLAEELRLMGVKE